MAYDNIRRLLTAQGKTQAELARYLNKTPATVTNLLDGTKELKIPEARKIASFLETHITHVIGDGLRLLVPVLGYVGAGESVYCYDAVSEPLEEVEPPTGHYAENIACVAVRGSSMEPMLEDNWLLFYRKDFDGVPSDCIGKLCIVKLVDDGMLVKKVRQGSAPGLHHLLSKNAMYETLFDKRLQWASRVIDIRPR